ncbi:unnamed protein product [Colias eurytheme]|nr:unnamed protein product [Colias eurytheme]
MLLLLTFLLVTLDCNAAYASKGDTSNCKSENKTIVCSVRILETNGSSLAITSAEYSSRLFIECNQLLLFESHLLANYFQKFSKLEDLSIHNCKLLRIPGNAFEGLRELKKLSIRSKNYDWSSNKNLELSLGTFNGLRELQSLDLGENNLKVIPSDVFCPLDNLQKLNLTHNKIKNIDRIGLGNNCGLDILSLDLSYNELKTLNEDSEIAALRRLQELRLQNNNISDISSEIFNGLISLRVLNISHNNLQFIPEGTFANTKELREIYLNDNQLFELDLGENLITDIKNGSFKNLDQLTGLRLIENQIGNLTKGMFWDLPSLQVLNLAKNKIQAIERGCFERNKQLEAIRLDRNFIVDINGVFSSVLSLLWLNLSENHLVWFDYAFVPSNLKWLDIHSNYIEHLGNYYKLQGEIKITTLDVSRNRITEISPLVIPNSVEVLFINNNRITNVQVNTFMDKRNLTRVDMYQNFLTHLDLNSLRLFPVSLNKSLPEFYIGGNPIDCDCSMEWLPLINNMTTSRQYPRIMDLENVICKMTHTRSVTHITLSNLKATDFLCTYETHCFTLCHCCDYVACDCQMTCPNNCSCYHDPTWHTNVVDCSAQKAVDLPEKIPMDATEVYLDGNKFKELQNYAFIGRKNMRSLYVNSSEVESIQNRTFAGLSSLVILNLADNKLTHLYGMNSNTYPN